MVVEVGREPPPSPLSKVFEKLASAQSKKSAKGAPPKFIKRIEDVPEVALPLEGHHSGCSLIGRSSVDRAIHRTLALA